MIFHLILVPANILMNILTNLGKYTSQKGFIFLMASKMAAGSIEWLYLKWKMLQKNV